MLHRTRNFLVGSLLVLCAGVGTGLVAYYGFPTSAFTAAAGPDELKFLPSNATLVAFAEVHEVMTSDVRQKLRTARAFESTGQRSFQDETGIDIETDVDRVVFAVTPALEPGQRMPASGLVIARGRFDAVKIESSMRGLGASVEDHKGTRIITTSRQPARTPAPGIDPQPPTPSSPSESFSLAFIEPGLVAVGGSALVRRAIDLKEGGDSVVANEEIMRRVGALDRGNVWAVGRFDALTSQSNLAQTMVGQLPAISWFAVSAQVDSGISAVVRADTRDEEAANALRDVVRGFVALARMQAGSRPELQPLLQSLQLGGTGPTVTLSLDLTPQTLALLTGALRAPIQPRR